MVQAELPPIGNCVECGKRLTSPYWVTDHPDGVHHECRRWEAEAWPFDDRLKRLRTWRYRTKRLVRDIDALGRMMVRARKHWPLDAKQVADEILRRWDELEARARKK